MIKSEGTNTLVSLARRVKSIAERSISRNSKKFVGKNMEIILRNMAVNKTASQGINN